MKRHSSLEIRYQKGCQASEHAVRNIQPLAEQRKKQWKVYGLVKNKIHRVFTLVLFLLGWLYPKQQQQRKQWHKKVVAA